MIFSLIAVLSILIVHYIGDFLLQTEYQSITKKNNNGSLFEHVSTYTLTWTIYLLFLFCMSGFAVPLVEGIVGFILVTFFSHFTTDYITSRFNAYLLDQNKGVYMPFFRGVGLDQLLHYLQLFITWNYFIKL